MGVLFYTFVVATLVNRVQKSGSHGLRSCVGKISHVPRYGLRVRHTLTSYIALLCLN